MKYNKPEYKVVEMTEEDVLTASKLDDATSGWEVPPIGGGTGGGTSLINL